MDRQAIIEKLEEKILETADLLSENQQMHEEVVDTEKQLRQFFKDEVIDKLMFDIEMVRIKRIYERLEDHKIRIIKQKKMALEQLERLEENE